MRQTIRIFLLFVMVSVAAKPALARCGATTCTEAYNACMGTHCFEEGGRKKCDQQCRPRYLDCLQTGDFQGRQCQKTGLIRK